jgi:hypothetical protein
MAQYVILPEALRRIRQPTTNVPSRQPQCDLGNSNRVNSIFPAGFLFGLPEVFFDGSLLWHADGVSRRVMVLGGA